MLSIRDTLEFAERIQSQFKRDLYSGVGFSLIVFSTAMFPQFIWHMIVITTISMGYNAIVRLVKYLIDWKYGVRYEAVQWKREEAKANYEFQAANDRLRARILIRKLTAWDVRLKEIELRMSGNELPTDELVALQEELAILEKEDLAVDIKELMMKYQEDLDFDDLPSAAQKVFEDLEGVGAKLEAFDILKEIEGDLDE